MNNIDRLKIVRNTKLIIINTDKTWRACFSNVRQAGSQASCSEKYRNISHSLAPNNKVPQNQGADRNRVHQESSRFGRESTYTQPPLKMPI